MRIALIFMFFTVAITVPIDPQFWRHFEEMQERAKVSVVARTHLGFQSADTPRSRRRADNAQATVRTVFQNVQRGR